MSDILQNILISLGTSAVVGLFTFAFGMKSGKTKLIARRYREYMSIF